MTQTIHEIIFVDEVLSIDEMYGRLPPKWQILTSQRKGSRNQKGIKKGYWLKDNRIYRHCRISFIAKLASKINKPNGLLLVDYEQLPNALEKLCFDITGIGARMLIRLKAPCDIKTLYQAERSTLHRIWGSIEGDPFGMLEGIALPEKQTHKRTIGHSCIAPYVKKPRRGFFIPSNARKSLPPPGMNEYFTTHLLLQVKFGFEWRWQESIRCSPTQDTLIVSRLLNILWDCRPKMAPNQQKSPLP